MARSSFSGFHSHKVPVGSLNFQVKPFSPAVHWSKRMGPLLLMVLFLVSGTIRSLAEQFSVSPSF